MLIVDNISCFVQKKLLLDKISFSFKQGHIYSILGPNGSGKSTFLKVIMGIHPAFSGTIFWQNDPLCQMSRKARSQIMTLVPQAPNVSFDFSVKEFVEMGIYASQQPPATSFLEECLLNVDALHLINEKVRTLSSGERQRVYIARALLSNAPILLFDEPTANLDIRHRLDIWKLIDLLKKQKKILIIATHDFHDAKKGSDEVLVMHKGRLISHGPFDKALGSNVIEEVFHVNNQTLY